MCRLLCIVISLSACTSLWAKYCQVPAYVIQDIQSYRPDVRKILRSKNTNAAKNELENFQLMFPNRITGSIMLEHSIEFITNQAKNDGFHVHTEKVNVDYWTRGKETLYMNKPHKLQMEILGLGYSIGTWKWPKQILTAFAIVVKSFEEMEKLGKTEINKKILIMNAPFSSKTSTTNQTTYEMYAETVKYRLNSASKAALYGALAVLVRSRTDFSLYTAHTGMQVYDKTIPHIPAAAITTEDADMLQKLYDKGETIQLSLEMEAKTASGMTSHNVVIELEGDKKNDEIIILSSHLDTWDVGGAMDNGAGVFTNYQSLKILKNMRLKRKRTIRLILWTGEEVGYVGVKDYIKKHRNVMNQTVIAIENDSGVYKPLGLRFSGSKSGSCYIQQLVSLFEPIGATQMSEPAYMSEVKFFEEQQIPALSLLANSDKYFWHHHSKADVTSAIDSKAMDDTSVLLAATIHVLSNAELNVPRHSDWMKFNRAISTFPQVTLVLTFMSIFCSKYLYI